MAGTVSKPVLVRISLVDVWYRVSLTGNGKTRVAFAYDLAGALLLARRRLRPLFYEEQTG